MIPREPNRRKISFSFILPKSLLTLLVCFLGALVSEAGSFVITMAPGSSEESIQRTLDRLPEGGEVLLPPGTYDIRRPIVLRYDRVTLRGSGSNTVLRLADKANCPVVILGSPT